MKVGIQVDHLLCKTEAEGTDLRSVADESWWAQLEPKEDFSEAINLINAYKIDAYFMAERPKELILVTRSWLTRHGFKATKQNIVMDAIQRFDCRQMGMDYSITTDTYWFPWYVHEKTEAVLVDTGGPVSSLASAITVCLNKEYLDGTYKD